MRTEIIPGVDTDSGVAFGKPVIAGTRTPVAVILGEMAGGASVEEIRREYDLSEDQIRAAFAYAAWLAGQEVVATRAF